MQDKSAKPNVKSNGNQRSFFSNTDTARAEREARVILALMRNGVPMLAAIQKVAARVVQIERGKNGRKPIGNGR
jgi:hypothetical protein